MATATPAPEPPPPAASFEEALQRLEALVEAMESGALPLAELVAKYEEGDRLLKLCEQYLGQAELVVERLRKEREKVAFVAFDPEANAGR